MRGLTMFLLLATVACSPSVPQDEVVPVEATDASMNDAIAEAKATVGEFIEALEGGAPGDDGFSVKVEVDDGESIEFFWLSDVTYADGVFSGKIDNDPQFVSNIEKGQDYSVPQGEIADWMFFRDGVAVGNRTVRALFPHMPEEEVAALRELFGWD